MPNYDITRVAGNIGALNALNALQNINKRLSIHQLRLATGRRINEAADDPSGWSMAVTFDVRRQGIKTALNSIGDSRNLLSNMEGGLKKVQDILVKMRNKAQEAQGDTIGDNERTAIQTQLRAYRDEINDIVNETQWNNTYLLGSFTSSSAQATTGSGLNLMTGAAGGMSLFGFEGSGSVSTMSVTSSSAGGVTTNTVVLGITGSGSAATAGKIQTLQSYASDVLTGATGSYAGASNVTGLGLNNYNLTVEGSGSAGVTNRLHAFNAIDHALSVVKQGVAQVGAFSARLSFKEESLTVQYTNTEATYNRIMNANMAEEQVNASKFMILQQTATAMLAQANMAPQFLLSLFQ